MFGFLPSWVSDIFILISFVVGPGGVIWLLLQQKNANKKLQVEEIGQQGLLTIDQFNAALPAYKDLLDRSNKDRDNAIEQMRKYKEELDTIRVKQDRLIRLFQSVVERTNITLSQEEWEELEATKPTHLFMKRRFSHPPRNA